MSAYRLTQAADADLDEIWGYVALASGVVAADKLEEELHETMQRVADAPGMGHIRR